MRQALGWLEMRLPQGWRDVVRQLALFAIAYAGYELVRGLVATGGSKPFADADRIISLERHLHVFVEPRVEAWGRHVHVLMELADVLYLNANFVVTALALAFIYLRRNDSFYFVRNMFMIAMAIALVGYAVYPTAPPRLLPAWGFTDPVQQFTGIDAERGPGSMFLNLYAAVPSMHVCFSIMIGTPMARLVKRRWAKLLWLTYPPVVCFVVVLTGNHFLVDVVLGAVTACVASLLAHRLLARARPETWAFSPAPA